MTSSQFWMWTGVFLSYCGLMTLGMLVWWAGDIIMALSVTLNFALMCGHLWYNNYK